MSASPCPECGLPPGVLVSGKWSSLNKVMAFRLDPGPISIRPRHRYWCREGNKYQPIGPPSRKPNHK